MAVLSIARGSLTIPNPGDDREVLPGDTLLCFGKLLTLKSMLPVKPRRKVRQVQRTKKGRVA